MNVKIIKVLTILLLLAQATLFGQQGTSFVKTKGALQNKALCGIEFLNETSVYINIASITSISKQIYIAGPLEVREFSIDTNGNSQIRIYHASPIDPQNQISTAANKLPTEIASRAKPHIETAVEKANAVKEKVPFANDAEKNAGISNVYKIYPSTTHSKTLEFAVATKEAFDSLYKQFQEAFSSNKSELLSSTLFKEI